MLTKNYEQEGDIITFFTKNNEKIVFYCDPAVRQDDVCRYTVTGVDAVVESINGIFDYQEEDFDLTEIFKETDHIANKLFENNELSFKQGDSW